MSNLEELIGRLCPDGVEYKPLWSVTAWDKKFNAVDRSMQAKTYSYHVLLAKDLFAMKQETGDVFLLSTGVETGWTTEEIAGDFICEGEVVTIPWGKSSPVKGLIKYYNGKFVTGDNRIATSLDTNILDNKYLYYWMVNNGEAIDKFYRGSGIKHPSMYDVLTMKLPVPPLEVQREIVRILDNFTFLTTELAAELAARQKQYEYYRDLLLTFKPNESTILNERTNELEINAPVRWMKLGDTCLHSCSGATPKKSNSEYYVGGTVPWIRTQNVTFNNIYSVDSFITEQAVQETAAKWIPENCVIVAISGASAGRCAINKIKATTNQHCLNMEIDSSKALYKYVFYCLCHQYEELLSKKQGARGDLNSSLILETMIPVPPLEVQQRIVDILDRFDSLCNDITSGLPAEIEARQKQYEYYRDKLLTFKELKKEA